MSVMVSSRVAGEIAGGEGQELFDEDVLQVTDRLVSACWTVNVLATGGGAAAVTADGGTAIVWPVSVPLNGALGWPVIVAVQLPVGSCGTLTV